MNIFITITSVIGTCSVICGGLEIIAKATEWTIADDIFVAKIRKAITCAQKILDYPALNRTK